MSATSARNSASTRARASRGALATKLTERKRPTNPSRSSSCRWSNRASSTGPNSSLAPEHAAEPVDPDRPVEGARLETLRAYEAALARRLRGAAGGHWRGAWTGIYDVTPDWEPVLGAVPDADGVYVAAGFSGHGFKLAPAVGLSITELVCDGETATFDLALLAPGRFERGELIGARYGYSVLG